MTSAQSSPSAPPSSSFSLSLALLSLWSPSHGLLLRPQSMQVKKIAIKVHFQFLHISKIEKNIIAVIAIQKGQTFSQ